MTTFPSKRGANVIYVFDTFGTFVILYAKKLQIVIFFLPKAYTYQKSIILAPSKAVK